MECEIVSYEYEFQDDIHNVSLFYFKSYQTPLLMKDIKKFKEKNRYTFIMNSSKKPQNIYYAYRTDDVSEIPISPMFYNFKIFDKWWKNNKSTLENSRWKVAVRDDLWERM